MSHDTQQNRIGDSAGESGVSRRTLLKLAGGSAGITVLGTGFGVASDGPRHLQVRKPSGLCDTVPGDHHLGLVEDSSHTSGRGFYAGTSSETWTFAGWLRQTRPSETATGSVTPDSGVSEPSHRLIQVRQPSDLQDHKPTDQHFAFIEDAGHERGRGFYVGTKEKTDDCFLLLCDEEVEWKWTFVGWLRQLESDSVASGSVTPASGATRPSNRLLQVAKPADLREADPSDHHLAFIRDESHERGRGFYAGGADGNWYFTGWLAQSRPSGQASDTIDPNGRECGGGSSGGGGGSDTNTNYVFVTERELETQKQRVNDDEEPWKTAHDDLISDADNALSTNLRAVTDDDGDHDFDIGGDDYPAALDMSNWALDCGLAYWFTGKDEYAERVVEVLHHWCLKDSTYMIPTTEVDNNNVTIRQHVTIPGLVYAASFVRRHSAWGRYDGSRPWDGGDAGDAESAFQQWVEDRYGTFVSSQPGYCEYNNKWAWRIADRAASAAYLRDDSKMDEAVCMWKANCNQCDDSGDPDHRPWTDFVNNYKDGRAYDGSADPNNNGLFKRELNRSDGFTYTGFNLEAMMLTPVIVDRYDGRDLYSFNGPTDDKSGSSLWKAFNWFEEYVRDSDAWQWDEDGNVDSKDMGYAPPGYELAYAHWSDFKGAITKPDIISGRPHEGYYYMRKITLTHGAE